MVDMMADYLAVTTETMMVGGKVAQLGNQTVVELAGVMVEKLEFLKVEKMVVLSVEK